MTIHELSYFLAADRYALGRSRVPRFYGDGVWKFQIALRLCEYFKEKKGLYRVVYVFLKWLKYKLGLKLGLDIPEGVFGPGLRINHFGNIVVSANCKIGCWCDIHQE